MESKTRILVVDDIESIRALFAEILRREGYEVKEACNGKDGLQMARQWQPDLMLLDVMLPDCNGMELCRQIKSDPGLPTTFVILCSGEATSGSDKIQGADTGADDYLVKPVSYSELIARVRTMVRLQHANVALRASEQHWRRLVEILPDAVMMLSSGGHLLSANPKGAALLGYQSPEELPGKNMFELVEPAEAELLRADIAEVMSTKTSHNVQHILRQKNGLPVPVEISFAVLDEAPSLPRQIIMIVRDISRRQQMERQRAAFAQLSYGLSAADTAAQAARIILDIAAGLLGWDAGYVHLYSERMDKIIPVLTMDTVEGQRVTVSPDTNQEPTPLMRRVMQEGGQLINRGDGIAASEHLVPFGDTSRRSASMLYTPVHSAGAVVGILSIQSYSPLAYSVDDLRLLQTLGDHCGDALRRIRSDEALRESEALFSTVFRASPIAIGISTKDDGKYVNVNDTFVQMFGFTQEEIIGRDDLELKLWPVAEERKELLKILHDKGRVQQFEARFRRKSGEIGNVLISAEVIELHGHQYILGKLLDITERKRAEEALREVEARSRAILDNISDPAWLKDAQGRYLATNGAMAKFLNKKIEDIVGRTGFELNLPDAPRMTEEDAEVLQKRRAVIFDIQRLDQRGRTHWFESIKSPLFGKNGDIVGTVGISRDVTDHKRLEDELRRIPQRILEAQEFERARVARELHDGVNQLIASVQMRLRRVEESVPDFRPATREILTRCHNLLVQALEENRRIAHNLRPAELDELGLAESCRHLCKEFHARTNLDVKCQIDTPTPNLSPAAELNLFRIAQEAFTNAERYARATSIRLRITAQDDSLTLKIHDDGCGFDTETLRAGASPGTGMGLSNIRERAATLGGTCEIKSSRGHGTTISVRVPILVPASPPAPPLSESNVG